MREENKDWDPIVFIDYEFAAYNYRKGTVTDAESGERSNCMASKSNILTGQIFVISNSGSNSGVSTLRTILWCGSTTMLQR